jgi:flagellar basal body-associated protein FliL
VKKSRNRILYLIAALVGAIFIFTAGTMAIMVSKEIEEGEPPERVEEAHLMVEEVFFIKSDTRADSGEVDILTTAYITNDGLADAENVEIHAYPRNQRYNLGSDKTKTFVGKIPKQKTAEIEFIVGVPMGEKIEVELLTLEKGRLIMTGSGSVVISGTSSSAEKYRTNTVTGTHNDTDYDGMPDAWESYYGLKPSDPNDAHSDADGDGLTNLDEYKQSTEPCDAASKPKSSGLFGDGDDGIANSSSSLMGLIVIVIVIIIIIIIGIIISKVQTNREDKNKKSENIQQTWTKPLSSPGYTQTQPYQSGWRCPKCGGWLSNGQCINCGVRYSLSPVQAPQVMGNVKNTEESKNE